MRIKSLELVGFKSFLEKTSLSFDVPLTSIVGPNGCGKSNVVDALKWVTGELSYKMLRGKTMEDLIFAGSELRPPTSMMEVQICLDNHLQSAPPQYNEFTEINVVRRIFRDGSSEFYINKASCRLRDIIDLFMDTGIGQSSYSIIEQGRVGQIVSSRSEDRRLIIEEAAGITKFKTRKKAALRKMDNTKQNLLRVSDILKELTRQIGTLDRQAKKAEKYQELKKDIETLDMQFLGQSWIKKNESIELLQGKATTFQESVNNEESQLSTQESLHEQKKIELLEIEKELEQAQEQVFEKRTAVQDIENSIENCNLKKKQLEDTILEEKSRAELLAKKNVELEEQIARIKLDLENLEQDKENLSQRISADGETELELRAVVSRVEAELEEHNKTIFETAKKESEFQNQIHSIIQRQNSLEKNRADLLAKREELESSLEKLKEQRAFKEKEFQESTQLCLEFEKSKDSAQSSYEEMQKQRESLRDEVVALGNSIEGKKSRLNTLEEFVNTYQGYEKGVRIIMTEKNNEDGQLKNVMGILGDMLEVEPGYERAVQAALAEYIECVVVEKADDAISAVDFLKNRNDGRGSFMIQNDSTFSFGRSDSGLNDNSLENFVKAKGELGERVKNILKSSYLVTNLKEAVDFWKDGKKFCFVTHEGDRVSRSGIVTGGTWDEQHGVLEIRNQVDELKKILSSEESEYASKSDQVVKIEDEIIELQASIKSISQELAEQSQVSVSREKEFHSLVENIRFSEASLSELKERIQFIDSDLSSLVVEKTGVDDHLKGIISTKNNLEEIQSQISQNLQKVRSDFDHHAQTLNEMKVKKASLDERIEAFKRERESSSRQKEEAVLEREKLIQRADQRSEEVIQFRQQAQVLEGERSQAIVECEVKEDAHRSVKIKHDEYVAEIKEQEDTLKTLRSEKEDLFNHLNQVKMNIQEEQHARDRLSEQALERYELILLDYVEQHQLKDQLIEDEVLQENAGKIEGLRNKMSKMGNVHLGALDELKELQEREVFLSEQKDDLEESLKSLTEAIKKIDSTTVELFMETYEKVNAKFKELFPKLFKGGKAKLVMLDSENVLESGIDIVAQPPGKRLQNMNLMSGGEKALTAIALIFSIFQFKAPPFCILDEVDAPLDDANVGRFINMVKEMSDKTQFIVITHNKMTMEIADNLYGVTMEEPGVSRVVSVRVNETVDSQGELPESQQVA